MKDRQRIEGVIYREVSLTRDAIVDEEERTVRISFSSELPVLRASWFEDPWLETLGHKKAEVNLDRLKTGATVHYNHSRKREDRIGVVDSAKISEHRGEAVVRFSKNDRVNDVWEDVRDGVLRNVSVGYSIDERKLVRDGGSGEPDEWRVTRWTPMEISFVDIPADHTVGVGRDGKDANLQYRAPGVPAAGECYRIINLESEEEEDVNEKTREDSKTADDGKVDEGKTRDAGGNIVNLDKVRKDATADGRRMEAERRKEIRGVFEPFKDKLGDQYEIVREACIDDGDCSVEAARQRLLKALGKGLTPTGGDGTSVQPGEQEEDKFRAAALECVSVRARIIKPDKIGENPLRGYTLIELARAFIEINGGSTKRVGKLDLVGRAFTSSDFPLILADVANKAMLKGFDESPETWMTWAQRGNLSDFKVGKRVNLSSFDDLVLVNENGEFKYGVFTEEGESIQLATYGKLFSISRQAIINDDINAFTAIPGRMGRSASRVVGDLAYGVVTGNPLMGDGVALFAAGHNNLVTGAGEGNMTVINFGLMRNLMALQSDVSGSATGLNIRPSFMLTPVAREDEAKVLMVSETDPAQANARVPNIVRAAAEVIADPRLDADSAVTWYLAAGQQFDTIEVAFLDGVESPLLEQQMGWTVDGTEFKVRIDVGVAPMSFRSWVRNTGTVV